MRVSSANFLKNYGALTDKAITEPVTITRNGRDRLVLMAVEEYERLRTRDRRALALEEFTDAEIEAIARTDVAAEHTHLDAELEEQKY